MINRFENSGFVPIIEVEGREGEVFQVYYLFKKRVFFVPEGFMFLLGQGRGGYMWVTFLL